MKKYIGECIGTFALVFCGTGALIIDEVAKGAVSHVGVAITFGLVVMAMIYAIGDKSGAHFNPAVTIARVFSDSFAGIAPISVLPIIAAQIIGATVGYFASRSLFKIN